ncbi:Ig-like domain-containing protein [Meiothermus sp. Pnk-1]|uniref:Ig-like domain-containing protein n=2 Tax=unclassified Meiothermus TaxID=370471 RepID=UPI000D7BFFEC|nr:Ig-like domain-containing protein [Meiothermus sp. Pnk-1]PZA05800.1 hypothetical protein DNA98_16720 [Meiothermus sp. Pnk-1]
MHQRTWQIVMAVALGGLLAACGGGGSGGGGGGGSGLATIVVSPASASVAVGATQAFTAVAKDANGNTLSGVSFTWSSSNPAVASINSSGLATGIAAGTTQITAKAGSVTSNAATLSVTAGGGGGGGNGSFTLSLTPGAPSAGQGGSATVQVGVNRSNGTVGNVNLTLLGSAVSPTADPAKISYSFSPNPETGSGSTLTLSVGANVPPGSYALTVQGQSSGDTETAPLSLTVTAPHTVLLVDDDRSDNNSNTGSTNLSVSDTLFRNLLTAAGVGYDVFVAPANGNGPTFDQMKGYAKVVWYTGNAYGGSGYGTLSSADELSLKAYLDQGSRELLLFSSEYPYDIGADWTSTNSDSFFANYLGAQGGKEDPNSHTAGGGLNHKSFSVAGVAGTVTAGDAYTVQKDAPLYTYTSAINPASGTDTLLTAQADPDNTGTDHPVAVATGRKGVGTAGSSKVVYVGITLENLFETGSADANKAQLLGQLLSY